MDGRNVVALVSLKEIEEAQKTLKAVLSPTPLHHSPSLSEIFGAEIYLKLECYQPIKVFKIRGAYNKILSLSEYQLKKGLVTASSGNHGIAVAYVAKKVGSHATVCVPLGANPAKTSLIKRLGGEIVEAGSIYDDSFVNALRIKNETDATLVHPFDDPAIVAGQGVAGLEIVHQLPELNTVIVAIGGGGLISGIASAVKNLKPKVKVWGVQPRGAASMHESIKNGRIVKLPTLDTIADGLAARQPGNLTFESVRKYVEGVMLVTDDAIKEAVITLLREEHVLAEPSGVAPLAVLGKEYSPKPGEKIALVISGGNISLNLLKDLLGNCVNSEPKS